MVQSHKNETLMSQEKKIQFQMLVCNILITHISYFAWTN